MIERSPPGGACLLPLSLSLALSLGLAACADLPLGASPEDREPASIEVQVERDLAVEGTEVGVQVTLLDSAGRPIQDLPPWVQGSWRALNTAVVRVSGGTATEARLEAVGPGESMVQLQVAGQQTSFPLRVNPTAVQVDTDLYLNQAVQRSDGSIPLVAGRDAVLRVFVTADRTNFFAPGATVRFVRDDEVVLTLVAPPLDGIPTTTDEGNLATSFTLPVPGHVLQPGTGIVVEVGTDGTVPLLEGSRTRFPDEGVAELDIREVTPFRVRFVPVHQPGLLQVSLTPGNLEQFMGPTRAVFPLAEVEVQLREPYLASTTTATPEGWSQILHELRVLRAMEGDPIYYHGIIRRIAHWAGLAYVGWPIALTYDALPQAGWTVAHELGHNFGRRHAPCGNPSGVDTAFPHPGGASGVHGMDVERLEARSPQVPDLMGYCQPRWISDHNYLAVMNFRASEGIRWSVAGEAREGVDAPRTAPEFPGLAGTPDLAAAAAGGAGLLFWGRLHEGRLMVDPPLPVEASTLPPRPGPWTLVGRDAGGAVLFQAPFAMEELSKGPSSSAHFTFTLPLDASRVSALARIEVTGPEGSAHQLPSGITPGRVAGDGTGAGAHALAGNALGAGGAGGAGSAGEDRVILSWDATAEPLALVRDAETGTILSLARGGRVELPTRARALELTLSDGIRTRTVHLPVEGAMGGGR